MQHPRRLDVALSADSSFAAFLNQSEVTAATLTSTMRKVIILLTILMMMVFNVCAVCYVSEVLLPQRNTSEQRVFEIQPVHEVN